MLTIDQIKQQMVQRFGQDHIMEVETLVPYVNNSRTHSDKQVQQIISSIKEWGFTNPVLTDECDIIIAGHGRVMALKAMGINTVPFIKIEGLSDAQKKAYVIADNKLALNAGWDEEMLAVEIQHLGDLSFDIDLLGFDDIELGDLKIELEKEIEEGEVPEADEDQEPFSKRGDVWVLGKHRLMCGDSTSKEDVNKLLNGNKIDIINTDPPYNVSFNGRSGKHDIIKNDDLSNDEFKEFISKVIDVVKYINPKHYYIWCNWSFYGLLQNLLEFKGCIVWAKNVFGMGNGYRHQHEFCLYNAKIDDNIKNESDLWNVKKDSNYQHPTQKPFELATRALSNHSDSNTVLDLFGRSGFTLLGAIQANKTSFIMELDEKYVDVIVKRYNNLDKYDIQLIRDGKTYQWNEIRDEVLAEV
jgi:DNA modification methylase